MAADSLRQKAAGLLVVRLGSNMNPPRRAEDDAREVASLIDRYGIGGLILFNGHWPETRQTLSELQRRARLPLLVMSDIERGLGQQVHGATLFPHARAFGEIEDVSMTERFAQITAREAIAAGVHVAFAPVADVSRNPKNPIISNRAFGETTETATSRAAAFVEGARREGMLTTAKHFPGHGNTSEDSHATLPEVRDDRDEIMRHDIPPFQATIAAGVELIMTAHVSYPALDDSGRPATLSKNILTDFLRGELGFEGTVISDSLHMEGIKQSVHSEADLAVDQIAAGVDMLLDPEDPEAIIEGVASAVESGRLSETRLDEALTRVQRLRAAITDRFGARVWTDPASAVPPSVVASNEHLQFAEEVARKSIQITGSVPFRSGEGVLAVLLRSHTSPFDPPEQPLGDALREALPGVDYREVTAASNQDALDVVGEAAERSSAVILALVVKPAAWQDFGLPDQLLDLASTFGRHDRLTVVSLGDRGVLRDYPNAECIIITHSDTPVSQRALANTLRPSA